MRIAVLGTGMVGRTLAPAFAAIGHDVVVGTRDPERTRARAEWAGSGLELATYADAVAGRQVVVNALSGAASLDALAETAGALAGTVLLDVANPLDFSGGFPPTLSVKDTDSLAEQIQRAHPEARVVKALNTVTASVMVNPSVVGEPDTTVFVAGDDPEARSLVAGLLRELGWRDVLELDGLAAARGLEMWLPLWLRLMQALGTGEFNIKVVRPPGAR